MLMGIVPCHVYCARKGDAVTPKTTRLNSNVAGSCSLCRHRKRWKDLSSRARDIWRYISWMSQLMATLFCRKRRSTFGGDCCSLGPALISSFSATPLLIPAASKTTRVLVVALSSRMMAKCGRYNPFTEPPHSLSDTRRMYPLARYLRMTSLYAVAAAESRHSRFSKLCRRPSAFARLSGMTGSSDFKGMPTQ